MGEQLLQDHLTPCSPAELYASLKAAWVRFAQDSAPTRAGLLVLLSHWALETGWGHYCHAFNLGNKKRVPGDGHDYVQFRCNEIINGQVVWIDPPAPGCQFVAFPDLDSGALDYFIGMRGQFRSAWPAVIAGDPAQFCHLLKLAHYYTADEALYTHNAVWCFNKLDATIPADPIVAASTEDGGVAAGSSS